MVDVGNYPTMLSQGRLLNVQRDQPTPDNEPSESAIEEANRQIPRITIDGPNKHHRVKSESDSATETEMSSSHRSSHHHSSSSSSKGKGKGRSSSSTSKSHKDDWSEITDPDERRRVQNRIAQRKFRDKAKEAKERQEREARDREHAGNAYHIPDPTDMGPDDEVSGLPWGSLSLKYVVSRGKARESESWRGSPREDRSYDGSQGQASDDRDAHYEDDSTYYGEDPVYYDYGSGSGSGYGGSSR